jgi:two-component system, NarL family, sensor histidine kinase NreB
VNGIPTIPPSAENLLNLVAGQLWSETGEDFFAEMVRHLASALGARIALMGELMGGSSHRMRTVTACVDGHIVDSFEYDLSGTPCENVMVGKVCYYPSAIAQLFPKDKLLAEMEAESYLGAPLISRTGHPLGLLAVLHRRPLADPSSAQRVLQFCAVRAAAELEHLRMMDALRENELRYRTLFEAANDAILLMRHDRFIQVNPKATELFGCAQKELLHRSPQEFSPPTQPDGRDSGEKARELIGRALAGESMIFEWRHQRRDGTLFDAEVSLRGLNIDKERLVQALVRDITARKQADEALTQSEERFRKTFRSSPLLMAIARTYGGIVDINDIALQRFGFTREEVLGRTTDDLRISVEPASDLRDELRKANYKVRNRETQYKTRSGELVTLLLSSALIQLGGEPHVLVMGQDVTEQKRQDDLMRILGSAVANARDAILITDADLDPTPTIVYANPAFTQLTGYIAKELCGHRTGIVLGTSRSDPKAVDDIREALLAGREFHGEVVNYAKDGRPLYLELDIVPVRNAAGRVSHYVAMRRDVSIRKKEELNRKKLLRLVLEAQTEERRRISRELHDHAGQLLTSMLLRLQVLKETSINDRAREAVEEISSVASSTLEDISRLARGLHPAVLDDLGLEEALRRAAQEFEASGVAIRIRIRGIRERLPQHMEREIYQILKEALTNVLKHSRATNVVLSLERRGASIVAMVKDNGTGFDFREGGTRGTHLGLVGMNERAALIGGSVLISSAPGAGTVVTLTVPLLESQEIMVADEPSQTKDADRDCR